MIRLRLRLTIYLGDLILDVWEGIMYYIRYYYDDFANFIYDVEAKLKEINNER